MKIFDVLLGRTKPAEANLDALFGLPGAVITLQAAEDLLPTNQAGVCYKAMAGQRFEKTSEEMSELLGLDSGTGGASGSGGRVRQETDQYGYEWIVVESPDFQELVNQVHVVNTTLEEQSYGPSLLCTVFGFAVSGGRAVAAIGHPGGAGSGGSAGAGGSGDAGGAGGSGDAGGAGGGGSADAGALPTDGAGWAGDSGSARAGSSAGAYLVYLYKRGTFYPFVPLPGREKRDVPTELRLADVLKEDLKVEPEKERWMPLWGLPVH